jgi:hypothetical protein
MDQDRKVKKLAIRRTTILALKMRTGIKTGEATCENACWSTGTNPIPETKCPLR